MERDKWILLGREEEKEMHEISSTCPIMLVILMGYI